VSPEFVDLLLGHLAPALSFAETLGIRRDLADTLGKRTAVLCECRLQCMHDGFGHTDTLAFRQLAGELGGPVIANMQCHQTSLELAEGRQEDTPESVMDKGAGVTTSAGICHPVHLMPRNATDPIALPIPAARRIWLRAQRLDTRAPFGAGAQGVADAVAHLGYVQIDTINVIERSHHHILFSRMPDYRRGDLRQAQSQDKSVFEYWTHALAYVPTEDLRFFVPDMKYYRRNGHKWFATVTPADTRKVMRLVRQGPLSIRDIDDDVLREKDHEWASRKPSKRALQLAFYEGLLTVSERQGMLKTYDLLLRHFGWDRLPKPATATEKFGYLLDRALRAQGIVSLDSICHLDAPSKAGIRKLIEARMRKGAMRAVALEGAGRQEHWTTPAALEDRSASEELVHVLSPFDPLIIQRKRTHLFFGHEHRFEAYVPKEKRVLGYFALPVLVDDKIVAAVDLKTDRQAKKLLMQKWTWVGEGTAKTAPRKAWKRRIEEELGRFEAFQLAE
jgi:uncharacterized protein YcaQ